MNWPCMGGSEAERSYRCPPHASFAKAQIEPNRFPRRGLLCYVQLKSR